MLYFIGESRVHQTTSQTDRWQITILCQFDLFLSQFLFLLQKLQFVEIDIQTIRFHGFYLIRIHISHLDILISRIIDNILEHGVLLFEHGCSIIALYGQVFYIEVHAFQIHLKTHLVVVESLRDVTKFFQSLDIVVHETYLFRGILCHIIHFSSLHDEILTCLFIREFVELVRNLSYIYGRIYHLIVERHLELEPCRSIILQGLSHIVRLSVCRTICNRYGRSKIVIKLGYRINLWEQLSLIFTDRILTLCYLITAFLQ